MLCVLLSTEDIAGHLNGLQILRMDTRRVYTLLCKNEFERQEWVKDLTRVVEEVEQKQDRSVQKAKEMMMQEWCKQT